jgi:Domain of unknown function (DUF4345)
MILKRITQVFLALMGLAFCKAGIEALLTPQTVLSNVGIELTNASALSSMRAVYGGMHFVFGLFCAWGIFKNPANSLMLVILYTTGFVTGRLISWGMDGTPNAFVITWLATEAFSLTVSISLLLLLRKKSVPDYDGKA